MCNQCGNFDTKVLNKLFKVKKNSGVKFLFEKTKYNDNMK